MLTRFISRRAIPITFQILKTTLMQNSRQLSSMNSRFTSPITISSKNVLYRLYSQDASAEHLTADFDYVKSVTSNSKVMIVDVREPDEIKEHGKIPNSVNIPLGNVSSVLSSMPDKEFEQTFSRPKPTEDTEIIFYCMIGKRSGMAQQNAINLGFKNVKNYVGSWNDWASKTQ